MTPDEYKTWRADFRRRFPVVIDWFRKLSDEHGAELRDLWYDEVFSKLDLRDCMAANQGMMAGTYERFNDFQLDQVPAHLKRVAGTIAMKRRSRLEAAEKRKRLEDALGRSAMRSEMAAVYSESLAFAAGQPRKDYIHSQSKRIFGE